MLRYVSKAIGCFTIDVGDNILIRRDIQNPVCIGDRSESDRFLVSSLLQTVRTFFFCLRVCECVRASVCVCRKSYKKPVCPSCLVEQICICDASCAPGFCVSLRERVNVGLSDREFHDNDACPRARAHQFACAIINALLVAINAYACVVCVCVCVKLSNNTLCEALAQKLKSLEIMYSWCLHNCRFDCVCVCVLFCLSQTTTCVTDI